MIPSDVLKMQEHVTFPGFLQHIGIWHTELLHILKADKTLSGTWFDDVLRSLAMVVFAERQVPF